MTSATAKLEAFERWMQANDVWMDPRLGFKQLQREGRGNGVVAQADLAQGTVVSRIPKKAVLSWRNSHCSAAIEAFKLRGGLAVVAALMYEWVQGEASPWFGYLAVLPPRENIPLFWTQDQQSLLGGTDLEAALDRSRKHLQEDYKTIKKLCRAHPTVFPVEKHTYEHFVNMGSLVASRAFHVDKYHGQAMVPLAGTDEVSKSRSV